MSPNENVESLQCKNKNNSKAGSVHENNKINEKFSDDIIHINTFYMDLAMQFNSNDKTVRSDRVHNLKEFNNQSLVTKDRKGKQLVSMKPAIRESFNLMGDDMVELSNENDALKDKIGSYDPQWLEESKAKLVN